MRNKKFPELDDWDEIIHRSLNDKNILSLIKATQKLVLSLANLRSSASSKLGYLNNKIERLQNSVEQLNNLFVELNENFKKADESSTKLASALNRLTFWGIIIAGGGVLVALLKFAFEIYKWFIQ